jgi:hypothetical protein
MAAKSNKKTDTDSDITPIASAKTINGFLVEDMPVEDTGPGASTKYPFGMLKVGQSFTVVGERAAANVRNAASKWSKSHTDYKFRVRTDVDSDTGTVKKVGEDKVYRCGRVLADAAK